MNALRLLFVSLWMKVLVLPSKFSLMEPLQDYYFFWNDFSGALSFSFLLLQCHSAGVSPMISCDQCLYCCNKIVVEFSGIQIIGYNG